MEGGGEGIREWSGGSERGGGGGEGIIGKWGEKGGKKNFKAKEISNEILKFKVVLCVGGGGWEGGEVVCEKEVGN